jgi:hypothetical protein
VVAAVRADSESAIELGLTGTPAFLIGRVQEDRLVRVMTAFTGARPLSEFARAIDDTLGTPNHASPWPAASVAGVLALIGSAIWVRRRRRARDGQRIPLGGGGGSLQQEEQ